MSISRLNILSPLDRWKIRARRGLNRRAASTSPQDASENAAISANPMIAFFMTKPFLSVMLAQQVEHPSARSKLRHRRLVDFAATNSDSVWSRQQKQAGLAGRVTA